MLTGELRNKIDRLWETFWTGGITNPLDVVEPTRQGERHARAIPQEHFCRRGENR